MSIDTRDMIEAIIRPVLRDMGMYSVAAEQLVAGTIAHESLMGAFLRQQGGPALGVAQMEPVTHDDIWDNYLKYHPELVSKLEVATWTDLGKVHPADLLVCNLKYAVAMCRIKYYRVSGALPLAGDVQGLAGYWKQNYNTPLGRGVVNDFIANYSKFVAPYYT